MTTTSKSKADVSEAAVTEHLEKAAHHYEKAAKHLREAAAKQSHDHDHAADHHILVGSAHAVQARKQTDIAVSGILATEG